MYTICPGPWRDKHTDGDQDKTCQRSFHGIPLFLFIPEGIGQFASSVGRDLSRVVPGTGNVRHRLVTRNLAPGPAPVA
jgi:hypothetical protein